MYGLNYYFLVPKFLHGGNAKWFYLVNILLVVGWTLFRYFPRHPIEFPQEVVDQFGRQNMWAFLVGAIIASVFLQALMILLAVGLRQVMRSNDLQMQMEEERRKTAEAELVWLKHQLNPHFLFNTLNNISSLTQIDPDKAQESIGQLSDLLRYALYDSEAEKVPLAAEMEFMNNYVDLMALRCNELTKVEKEFEAPQEHVEVAPLLFISLVENAFKHGVNARYPSYVKVKMYYRDAKVWFFCSNSVFYNNKPIESVEKSDKVGSGIGLENMKRRLELFYPGRYTYGFVEEKGDYTVTVSLQI